LQPGAAVPDGVAGSVALGGVSLLVECLVVVDAPIHIVVCLVFQLLQAGRTAPGEVRKWLTVNDFSYLAKEVY